MKRKTYSQARSCSPAG